ncbi:OsmC family protein [Fulvivirgaceae bacterium BMA10]|uniref:OsmC family protein n=1 Tax=Splendidivirga corallicola TaxID=3051826 RepID=A0ABT8KK89_9BACT|nr:OsmC family protein [Fulvivirgaceae bacterium BMA10]
MKEHHYNITMRWTGNLGKGTLDYKSYNRDHIVSVKGKGLEIPGSSDPSFLGDKTRYNPEELLVSSLSSCHMLWYLHLCAVNKIIVIDYVDNATGTMEEATNGSGRFREVTLNPVVKVKNEDMIEKADQLHAEANKMCFIANSCNFPIHHKATTMVKEN